MIRTLTEARRRFPRSMFVDFLDTDAFPGCDLKVWRHGFDAAGRVVVSGYLYRYECDDDGRVIARHPVWSEAQMADMWVSDIRVDEIQRSGGAR